MDYHALLQEVRGTLSPGRILIGNSDFVSSVGPRELFEAIQKVQNPLSFTTQAAIIVAFREKNGETAYRATN
jgi:hypothetical protein